MAAFFSFILAHSGDAADPELVHWIKERLDQALGSNPWTVVVIMGLFIFAIPVLVVVVYLMQGGRRSAAAPSTRPRKTNRLDHDKQEQDPV